MIKIVADTNILVSASFWHGNPYKIMLLAAKGRIEAFASIEIIEEFTNALRRDFKISEQEISERTENFLEIIKIVKPKRKIAEITEDPEDNKVLEAAAEIKADYVVSGDKHLLKLKEFEAIKIVKAKEFLELVK